MISSIVKSDTSSQMSKVLQRLDGYDVIFANQERVNGELQRVNGELQRMNEKLQRMNDNLQKTIAELSTNVARVSYTSSL
jgi:Skp family chaperone for outer membrane proteins